MPSDPDSRRARRAGRPGARARLRARRSAGADAARAARSRRAPRQGRLDHAAAVSRVASVPAAVAIMDAPGHGERRPPHLTDEAWEADVVARMGDPAVHAQVLAEWPLVIAEARRAVPAASGPVGYAGFSMGSIFGLSVVGDLPDVRAALFAVGGYVGEERGHSNAVNEMIANGIAKLGDREVLMVNMTDDESFPIARRDRGARRRFPGRARCTCTSAVTATCRPRRCPGWSASSGARSRTRCSRSHSPTRYLRRSVGPDPVADLGHVLEVLVDVEPVLGELLVAVADERVGAVGRRRARRTACLHRWYRLMLLSTTMSNGVVVVPSSR